MAENSKISWTDHTFNPWRGCEKKSAACKNCYAADLVNRYGGDFYGQRVLLAENGWKKPIAWDGIARAEKNLWDIINENPCICSQDIARWVQDPNVEREWLLPMEERGLIEGNKGNLGGWLPLPWNNPRVFCASLADIFEDFGGPIVDHNGGRMRVSPFDAWVSAGPLGAETDQQRMTDDYRDLTMDDIRKRLFQLIDKTPHLTWLLLTKRPENINRMWEPAANRETSHEAEYWFRPNVWLGVTVEDQEQADKRIPELLSCFDLAQITFVSCEPLLGPLDITPYLGGRSYKCKCGFHRTESELLFLGGNDYRCAECGATCETGPTIDFCISGGESGSNARPTHPDWLRSLRDQCLETETAFHHKQNGEWCDLRTAGGSEWTRTSQQPLKGKIDGPNAGEYKTAYPWKDDTYPCMVRVGKKKAGHLLDGVEHLAFPKVAE